MKSKFFFLVIATIALLTACNRGTPKWQVKTQYHIFKFKDRDSVYTSDGITRTYVYGVGGSLLSYHLSNGDSQQIVSAQTVDTIKMFDSKGQLVRVELWFKNKNFVPDSVVNNDASQSTHKFLYDDFGNKTEVRDYEHGRLHFLEKKYYSNGLNDSTVIEVMETVDTVSMMNPVTLKWDTIIQKTLGQKFTEYNSFYANRDSSSGYIKFLKDNWGDGSEQLKKMSTQISVKGDTMDIHNYRYTFDDKSRVTSIVSESTKNTDYDSTSYTYY